MKSKYEENILIVRAEKTGHSSAEFRRQGFVRTNHAEPFNRNAGDFFRPYSRADWPWAGPDWKRLARRGFQGIAFWVTGAQWQQNLPATEKQWRARLFID